MRIRTKRHELMISPGVFRSLVKGATLTTVVQTIGFFLLCYMTRRLESRDVMSVSALLALVLLGFSFCIIQALFFSNRHMLLQT